MRPDLHALPHDVPGGDPHEHLGGGWHARGGPLRVGIGGPVGSGKTALVAALCRALGERAALAVVTNDIYTTEDADFLRRNAVLPDERIGAVQTGCCPHTAIRDDITANLDAVDDLSSACRRSTSCWWSPAATTSPPRSATGWSTCRSSCVDVAGGDKVPRKGGPGVTGADLLVINKTDLAPLVGADLAVMADDARRVRGDRPVAMISLREDPSAAVVADWVRARLATRQPAPAG